MRALHIFPFFGSQLRDGAEHYQFLLSRKLVEMGVEVDVFTTNSSHVRFDSAFSLRWDDDYKDSFERIDGINIHRFAAHSIPGALGYSISVLMLRRWRREERRYGVMLPGSRNLVDYYYRRASTRPSIYDWMMLLARGPNSIGLLARLARSITTYDVVLVGFMPFGLISQVTRIAKALGKPVVMLALFHPEDAYHHFRALYRSFARADAVLAQTTYSAELIRRLFPGSNPVRIGAGVEAEAFADSKVSGARFRAKYGFEKDKLVLFVGRKEPSKRYDLAVQAIELINHERIKLVMIGRDIDARPISSSRVVYLGELPRADLVDAYDACDVFLMPSEYESFGIVFLEAWMRRKPVIGNRFCRAVASVIANAQDGFLCSGAEEIAEKIVQLLSDGSLALRLGEAGYQKVMKRYTWDAIGGEVADLYSHLVAQNAR